jgi:very-short-patch-repair endonuclease
MSKLPPKSAFLPQTPQGGLIVRDNYHMEELDKTMYFNATPEKMEIAKYLRNNMTHSEKLLWDKLKGKQICGLRFRRQHPIDLFIVDFYCHQVRLVIEVDGEIHDQQAEYDDGRSAEMEKFGIKILRFKNFEVENVIERVISEIESTVKERLKSPPLGDLGVKK